MSKQLKGWTYKYTLVLCAILLVAILLSFWSVLAVQIYLGVLLVVQILSNLEVYWLKRRAR